MTEQDEAVRRIVKRMEMFAAARQRDDIRQPNNSKAVASVVLGWARDLRAALATPPPVPAAPWADLPRCSYCNEKGTHAPQCDRPAVPAAPPLDVERLMAAIPPHLYCPHLREAITEALARLSPDQDPAGLRKDGIK